MNAEGVLLFLYCRAPLRVPFFVRCPPILVYMCVFFLNICVFLSSFLLALRAPPSQSEGI
jgi:hypothetical protein